MFKCFQLFCLPLKRDEVIQSRRANPNNTSAAGHPTEDSITSFQQNRFYNADDDKRSQKSANSKGSRKSKGSKKSKDLKKGLRSKHSARKTRKFRKSTRSQDLKTLSSEGEGTFRARNYFSGGDPYQLSGRSRDMSKPVSNYGIGKNADRMSNNVSVIPTELSKEHTPPTSFHELRSTSRPSTPNLCPTPTMSKRTADIQNEKAIDAEYSLTTSTEVSPLDKEVMDAVKEILGLDNNASLPDDVNEISRLVTDVRSAIEEKRQNEGKRQEEEKIMQQKRDAELEELYSKERIREKEQHGLLKEIEALRGEKKMKDIMQEKIVKLEELKERETAQREQAQAKALELEQEKENAKKTKTEFELKANQLEQDKQQLAKEKVELQKRQKQLEEKNEVERLGRERAKDELQKSKKEIQNLAKEKHAIEIEANKLKEAILEAKKANFVKTVVDATDHEKKLTKNEKRRLSKRLSKENIKISALEKEEKTNQDELARKIQELEEQKKLEAEKALQIQAAKDNADAMSNDYKKLQDLQIKEKEANKKMVQELQGLKEKDRKEKEAAKKYADELEENRLKAIREKDEMIRKLSESRLKELEAAEIKYQLYENAYEELKVLKENERKEAELRIQTETNKEIERKEEIVRKAAEEHEKLAIEFQNYKNIQFCESQKVFNELKELEIANEKEKLDKLEAEKKAQYYSEQKEMEKLQREKVELMAKKMEEQHENERKVREAKEIRLKKLEEERERERLEKIEIEKKEAREELEMQRLQKLEEERLGKEERMRLRAEKKEKQSKESQLKRQQRLEREAAEEQARLEKKLEKEQKIQKKERKEADRLKREEKIRIKQEATKQRHKQIEEQERNKKEYEKEQTFPEESMEKVKDLVEELRDIGYLENKQINLLKQSVIEKELETQETLKWLNDLEAMKKLEKEEALKRIKDLEKLRVKEKLEQKQFVHKNSAEIKWDFSMKESATDRNDDTLECSDRLSKISDGRDKIRLESLKDVDDTGKTISDNVIVGSHRLSLDSKNYETISKVEQKLIEVNNDIEKIQEGIEKIQKRKDIIKSCNKMKSTAEFADKKSNLKKEESSSSFELVKDQDVAEFVIINDKFNSMTKECYKEAIPIDRDETKQVKGAEDQKDMLSVSNGSTQRHSDNQYEQDVKNKVNQLMKDKDQVKDTNTGLGYQTPNRKNKKNEKVCEEIQEETSDDMRSKNLKQRHQDLVNKALKSNQIHKPQTAIKKSTPTEYPFAMTPPPLKKHESEGPIKTSEDDSEKAITEKKQTSGINKMIMGGLRQTMGRYSQNPSVITTPERSDKNRNVLINETLKKTTGKERSRVYSSQFSDKPEDNANNQTNDLKLNTSHYSQLNSALVTPDRVTRNENISKCYTTNTSLNTSQLQNNCNQDNSYWTTEPTTDNNNDREKKAAKDIVSNTLKQYHAEIGNTKVARKNVLPPRVQTQKEKKVRIDDEDQEKAVDTKTQNLGHYKTDTRINNKARSVISNDELHTPKSHNSALTSSKSLHQKKRTTFQDVKVVGGFTGDELKKPNDTSIKTFEIAAEVESNEQVATKTPKRQTKREIREQKQKEEEERARLEGPKAEEEEGEVKEEKVIMEVVPKKKFFMATIGGRSFNALAIKGVKSIGCHNVCSDLTSPLKSSKKTKSVIDNNSTIDKNDNNETPPEITNHRQHSKKSQANFAKTENVSMTSENPNEDSKSIGLNLTAVEVVQGDLPSFGKRGHKGTVSSLTGSGVNMSIDLPMGRKEHISSPTKKITDIYSKHKTAVKFDKNDSLNNSSTLKKGPNNRKVNSMYLANDEDEIGEKPEDKPTPAKSPVTAKLPNKKFTTFNVVQNKGMKLI